MVLIDPIAAAAPDAAHPQQAPARPNPHAALARLAVLREQAGHDLDLLQFLARAPQTCLVLLAAGAAVLLWGRLSAGSAPLEREFVWVLSVLIGVGAMTGLHIHSYARSAAPMPLHQAATRMRGLLFYIGMAWGAGAFLVLPDLPMPALAIGFAAVPGLALSLLLGARAAAFTAPAILANAGAVWSGPSGLWIAAATLAAGLLTVCLPMLQREISARREILPAPTAL